MNWAVMFHSDPGLEMSEITVIVALVALFGLLIARIASLRREADRQRRLLADQAKQIKQLDGMIHKVLKIEEPGESARKVKF